MQATVPAAPRARVSWAIAASTVAAIAVIALLSYADHQQAAAAALRDFARQQAVVAQGIAAGLEGVHALSFDARSLERDGDLVVLTRSDASSPLRTTAGRSCAALDAALARGSDTVELTRDDAAQLGLPVRRAEAGFARVQTDGGSQVIAVVASASRVRDRNVRGEWRLVVEFLLTASCGLAFGVYALRVQKERLALSREIAINEAVRSRDERLVRADKLATLGAMATGIAHEVSTPLGVIVGRAEQLGPRVKDDERASRSVAAITEQAARISAIVRGFLAFARGDAVSLQHLSALSVVQVATELVRHRFEAAEVSHEIVTEADLDPRVGIACDEALFPQVLVNLLLNACDACAPGSRVETRVAVVRDRVRFTILDEGEGITAENAARATEPFFTTKPAGRGTGIGLSIAKEIVLHHGGGIRVGPRRDGSHGTEASVEVPVIRGGDA